METLVILISGRGSNMESILKLCNEKYNIIVISNIAEAKGLQIASEYGVTSVVLDHKKFPDRISFDYALLEIIDSYNPKLVVLAGFMRILSNNFVNHYQGKLINIHPSLLPSFPGLSTHTRALQEGVKIHGCTIHFVTSKLDEGPIILQAAVPVLPSDDQYILASRVLQQENTFYPMVVDLFMTDKIRLNINQVEILDKDIKQFYFYDENC